MKAFYIYVVLVVIVILILLASCSPAKRMQRICIKHPELCKRDTFKIDGEIQVLNDTIYQDSIITLILNECDSILKARGLSHGIAMDTIKINRPWIKKKIKPQIPVYRCLNDTLKIDFKNGFVKVWQVSDKFKYEVVNIQPMVIFIPEEKKGVIDRVKEKATYVFIGLGLCLFCFSAGWLVAKI
jgi:hypothetical protein